MLQERLLSSRILSFGASQIYFECVCAQWFEASRYPIVNRFHRNRTQVRWLAGPLDLTKSYASSISERNDFYSIVTEYSKCQLSRIDDRLPAFSGIARRCQRYNGDEYHAGLWRNDLRGLTWVAPATSSRFQNDLALQTPRYPPPSWSWASCRGQVSFLADHSSQPLAEIVCVRTQPVGHDLYGQVAGGELLVNGTVKTCAISGEEVTITSDPVDNDIRENRMIAWFLRDKAQYLPQTTNSPQTAVCLLLTTTPDREQANSTKSWTALALESVRSQENTFRRIGLIYCSSWDDELDINVGDGLLWLQSGPRETVRVI